MQIGIYFTPGSTDYRGKGILVLISKRLCKASEIQYQHYDPGRLLHVRIQSKPRNLDLIACYQHTYQPNSHCLKLRATLWQQLETVLLHIPNRSNLVMVGDFNCHLTASAGVAGTSSFSWQGQLQTGLIHKDHARFIHLLRNYALVALNGWSSTLGPTYVHGDQASRLDFVFVRQMFADGEARRVKYLWQSPFLNQTQHCHVPILCTVARYWIPEFRMHSIQRTTMSQRQAGREAYLAQSLQWQHFNALFSSSNSESF